MSGQVRVVPEDLLVSAVTVDVHADTVHTGQLAADGRIDAAQKGTPLSSSAAMSTAVTKWQAQTTAIFGRMIDHSNGLRAGALAYQQADTDSGAAIDTAGERMTELDLGL